MSRCVCTVIRARGYPGNYWIALLGLAENIVFISSLLCRSYATCTFSNNFVKYILCGIWTTRTQDKSYQGQSYPRQLVPKSTCTQNNSYTRELVPRTTRTKVNSYTGQLVPKSTRTQLTSCPGQLVLRVIRTQDNSYSRQLVPKTIATQGMSNRRHLIHWYVL